MVAGGETAGIPYAAWIADRLGLPMQYVRKKPKGFGRNAQIEGDVREGARTLLVEDLTTDGRSKINFCQALRDAGAMVDHVFVNFYYDIFPESKKKLSDLDVQLHYLATWWDVLRGGEEGRLSRGRRRSPRWRNSCTRRRSGPPRTAASPSFPAARRLEGHHPQRQRHPFRRPQGPVPLACGAARRRRVPAGAEGHEADLDPRSCAPKGYERPFPLRGEEGLQRRRHLHAQRARRGEARLRHPGIRRRGPLHRGALRQALGDLGVPAVRLEPARTARSPSSAS